MARDSSAKFAGFFIIIFVFLLAFLIPAIALSIGETQKTTETIQESDSEIITGKIYTEISDLSVDNVTVKIIDQNNGIVSNETLLNTSESKDIELGSNNITVSYIDIVNQNHALLNFEYPTYINWPDGAKFILDNIILYILIVTVLLIIVLAFTAFGGN